MKHILSLFVIFAANSIFAAGSDTPKETCEALVLAAQQSNYEAFAKLSAMSMGHHSKGKKEGSTAGFEKMHKDQLEKLKALTCGTEHVADTRAFVETTTNGKTRFIPFIKEGSDWKFDPMTYMSFYKTGMMKDKKRH